jgi:6,7-dimethyl-8-ribityllumazine synthase|tara:strand:+ start:43 stop:567 length:525 start_codon:yes stop_codon:yes gene_type:complete
MKLKICIVVGKHYNDAADDLIKGATSLLDKYKKFEIISDYGPSNTFSGMFKEFADRDTSLRKHELEYKVLHAPGVFEIPLLISINIKKYNAFIALGCVIKGETPHFDFISSAAINGIMDLSIKHEMPIMNGIVTCLNKDQAIERCNPNKKNNGGKAAQALLHLLGISKEQNEAK